MPQMGFFIGAAGVGPFGIPLGVMNFYLAWDPLDSGVDGAMGVVYEWMSAASVLGGGRLRNFEPIKIAPLPTTGGYFGLQHRIVKFRIESGQATGGGSSDICDLTFEIYNDDSKLLYSASPTPDKPLKVTVKGGTFMTATGLGFQTRLDSMAAGDQATGIFNALMTRDGPLWFG